MTSQKRPFSLLNINDTQQTKKIKLDDSLTKLDHQIEIKDELELKYSKICEQVDIIANTPIETSGDYGTKVDLILSVEHSVWNTDGSYNNELVDLLVKLMKDKYKDNKYIECLIGLVLSKDNMIISYPHKNFCCGMPFKSWTSKFSQAENYLLSSIKKDFYFAYFALAKLCINNPIMGYNSHYYKNEPKKLLLKGMEYNDPHSKILYTMVYENSDSAEYCTDSNINSSELEKINSNDGKYAHYLASFSLYVLTLKTDCYEAYKWLLKCKTIDLYQEYTQDLIDEYIKKYGVTIQKQYVDRMIYRLGSANLLNSGVLIPLVKNILSDFDQLYKKLDEEEKMFKHVIKPELENKLNLKL